MPTRKHTGRPPPSAHAGSGVLEHRSSGGDITSRHSSSPSLGRDSCPPQPSADQQHQALVTTVHARLQQLQQAVAALDSSMRLHAQQPLGQGVPVQLTPSALATLSVQLSVPSACGPDAPACTPPLPATPPELQQRLSGGDAGAEAEAAAGALPPAAHAAASASAAPAPPPPCTGYMHLRQAIVNTERGRMG